MLPGGSNIVTQGVEVVALRLSNLRCLRDGRELFNDLTLTLEPGQVCELMGPNGAGKSTLLRCIAGLYSEYEGELEVGPAQYLGHRVALNALLDVTANLRWYNALAASDADLEATLMTVGLAGYGPVPVGRLSAGQQRRVALARLLVVASTVWLLDEPYTALDHQGQQLVDAMIDAHCANGGVVLCATHQALGCRVDHRVALGGG